MKINNHHPAYLWISDPQTLSTKVIAHIQKIICPEKGCLSCTTCMQIAAKEHPWVQWITPQKNYTVDQIDNIIHATSFQLDPEEKRLFILEQAHCLPDSCSNRLLKTIEEPQPGYYFFLLTHNSDTISETIRSRCIIKKFLPQDSQSNIAVMQPFLNLEFNEPIAFIKKIESLDLKEEDTKQIIDELFQHWAQTLTIETTKHQNSHQPATTMITILKQALQNPPMSGSGKVFWKNLFLTAHYALQPTKYKR